MCCNPYNEPFHPQSKASDLRPVPAWMSNYFVTTSNEKICSSCCLKKRWKQPEEEQYSKEDNLDEEFIDKDEALNNLNQCLTFLNEATIDLKKKKSESYIRSTLDHVKNVIIYKIFGFPDEPKQLNTDENSILESLKDQHEKADDKDLKQSLMKLCPKNWSCRKIKKELPNASTYAIKKCKKPSNTNTLNLNQTAEKSLKDSVKQFYCHDDISRIMPGKNDFKSVKVTFNYSQIITVFKINYIHRLITKEYIFKKDYCYVT